MKSNAGRTTKVLLIDPKKKGARVASASNQTSNWTVTPYSLGRHSANNPEGSYRHLMTVPVVYTYYKKLYLNSGQTWGCLRRTSG
ncbi:MAG: hypothetical protein LH606_21530 [Cytophagaceae bacterium]|nr:hypothetical protein [Cytophagaceae bacterium]